jgi:hypothetical protein
MNDNHPGPPESATQNFMVSDFRPEDAEGIVHLFHAVYGDHYPIRLFYDPQAIIDANASGEYYSIVARTDSGKIIGVTHLFPSTPCPSLYENGVGLVLKAYRNTGAFTRISEYLYNEFIPRHDNIEETFGESICSHVFTQKAVKHFKYIFTAMEIALMPAESYAKEKSASGRVAALCGFRCWKPRYHRIHIPASYETSLRWIYSRIDDSRDSVISEGSAPSDQQSRMTIQIFHYANVARIAVHAIGADFPDAFARIETEAIAGKAVVLQAWLDLGIPWVGSAVDVLREKGYFFGGALPRWFDTDGFLMQKLLCPPDFDGIVLDADTSRQLLDMVRLDWERTT